MGWIRAKNALQWSRGLIRWTSYRKLRRCKMSQLGDEPTIREEPIYSSPSISSLSIGEQFSCDALTRTGGCSSSNHMQHSKQLAVINRIELLHRINNTCQLNKQNNLNLNSRTCDSGHEMMEQQHSIRSKGSTRLAELSERKIVQQRKTYHRQTSIINLKPSRYNKFAMIIQMAMLFLCCFLFNNYLSGGESNLLHHQQTKLAPFMVSVVDASLIIGDSAIEIQEVDSGPPPKEQQQQQQQRHHHQQPQQSTSAQSQAYDGQPSLILGSTENHLAGSIQLSSGQAGSVHNENAQQVDKSQGANALAGVAAANKQRGALASNPMPSPLPPIVTGGGESGARKTRGPDDVTDGDKKSRKSHDYDMNDLGSPADSRSEKNELSEVLSATNQPISERDVDSDQNEKAITGKVVDFELTPAGGHNKAKIKKKKKKKKKEEEEAFKKWGKKKKAEKKAMEKKEKEHMKKKKEEGKKGKKKWGKEIHGQKKKGKFKKKKWGKKVKKGKGVKKGKKGKKFLKDKGHKNTGFKTVYHKEEWGKSSKWHDIKREKKWDEKSKKWKKKWKKEKGKKYKGDHMKKFEKKKKSGKKYKKEKKEKFKKTKKEEFKKGMKKKMEEHGKKKEGGAKKQLKEEKKKKKKKKS